MKWVLFDYGEVLSHPPSAEVGELFAAGFGVPVTRFWPAYRHGRERYDDRGVVDAAGYWRSVAGQLGTDGPADLDRLVGLDMRAWFDVNPDSLAPLEELTHDALLAMLSNAPHELAEKVDAAPWASLFRHRFFSARLGVTKPDPRIFEQVRDLHGTRPVEKLRLDLRA